MSDAILTPKRRRNDVTPRQFCRKLVEFFGGYVDFVAVVSAKNHKRQSVTAKREKSQTPKVLTAILTLPNLT